MSLIQDFFSLFAGCIALFVLQSRPQFGLTLLMGVTLAALCWFGCSHYSRLWNIRYRVTLTHHVLCALAAVLTLLFTVFFAALGYTKEAAYMSVQAWEQNINHDANWAETTFATTWHKVKSSGLENFSNVPSPGESESIIPITKPATIHLTVAAYAAASVDHFNKSRPFLSKILQAHTELPSQVLDADVTDYFATKGDTYPETRGVSLMASKITSELDEQLPRVVTTCRLLAIGLVLSIQFTLFGLVGVAAYRNLKVVT
jgi:hypothetical protein